MIELREAGADSSSLPVSHAFAVGNGAFDSRKNYKLFIIRRGGVRGDNLVTWGRKPIMVLKYS